MLTEEQIVTTARKRAEEKVGFLVHLGMYVVVNAFLIWLWWWPTGGNAFPWFAFPMFGWGIGLVAHFLAAFVEKGRMVDRFTQAEIERLRKQKV